VQKAVKKKHLGAAFGMTVRALRLRAGLSQETLALDAGVGRAYMSALERGLHNPTIGMAYRLLPHLNVSFAEFAAEFERNLRSARRKPL
jgi:transcriptional regulator with XRE-family HTH domain